MKRVLVATAIMAVVGAPLPLGALTDTAGVTIPNTGTATLTSQLLSGPSLAQMLLDPSSPADDSPASLAALQSIGDPETDLAAAIDAMAAATNTGDADAARQRALAILDGSPVAGKVYSGMPLLNWNGPAKVKTVPAGGNVVVNEVRFGEHSLSDTSLLEFADPAQPFTITYRVAELGTNTFGGALTPAPLLVDGTTPVGGLSSVVVPLTTPDMVAPTSEINRFHPGGAAEHARFAVQDITVKMPPPGALSAVLDPDVRAGHERLATLRPATADRITALTDAFGFTGATPTDAEKQAAIARLAAAAPEKVLYDDLRTLDPAAPTFLDSVHASAAQNHQLVNAMRTRYAIPAGVPTPAAGLDVALVNDEAYASTRTVRRVSGAVTVSFTNSDGFAHTFDAVDLHTRKQVFGALDWGQFAWTPLTAPFTLAAGESRTITLHPAADSFALWLGDPDRGDQGSIFVNVEPASVVHSVVMGDRSTPAGGNAPAHLTQDASGHVWVSLGGADKLVKITPGAGANLIAAQEEFIIPGGASTPGGAALGTHDITVDGRGIVWATLVLGNAIVRLDPALAHNGTSDGITVFPLTACNLPLPLCAPAFPPPPPPILPPSRIPDQMKVMLDGDTTIAWFSEAGADSIGAMRVSSAGQLLNYVDIPCDCGEPVGIDLAADGSVWFTEAVTNAIGRLTPSATDQLDVAGARITHVQIPSGVMIVPAAHPGIPINLTPPFVSSSPHSLAVDTLGRVWFTEEETATVGFIDPATAQPGVPLKVTEFAIPDTDFGAPMQPADLAIDRNNTVFIADEYGDIIQSLSDAGIGPRWRPAERASLTDSPMVDVNGDLWFAETGSNIISRVIGAGVPSLPPAVAPTFTANTTVGSVTGGQVRGASTVDVTIVRDGQQVASANGVTVTNGSFVAPVAVRGGDVVKVTPHGAFPRQPLTFSVASLTAMLPHDQGVVGTASNEGSPLASRVTVAVDGTTVNANVNRQTGKFTAVFPTPVAPNAAGTIVATSATPGATFQTVTGFAPAPPAPPAPPAASPPAVGPVAPAPLDFSLRLIPQGGPTAPAPAAPAPAAPTAAPAAPACDRTWLTANGQVALLGLNRAQLESCLGRPSRVLNRGATLKYGPNEIRLRNGVATTVILRNRMLTTAVGRIGVRSNVAELRSVLANVRIDKKHRVATAAATLTSGSVAGIRATTTRAGAITTIELSRRAG
jgi:streptogramin lyase